MNSLYPGGFYAFGLRDYARLIEDFVIARFCAIHFTITLAGLKNIVRYIEDFVKQRFVNRSSTAVL